ncbi:MAG: O-antigen ligase family protein, partial [Bacteriovorax sp.]
MNLMIYASMMVLALGLLTSMSLLGLVHILISVPSLYFIKKTNFKEMPKSSWALLGLCLAIVISVIANKSIMHDGLKPIFKVKYFVFGFLMIAPMSWYFKNYFNEKKISYLLYVFCTASLVAGIAGTIGRLTGFNPVSMKAVNLDRNAGLFGMVLNYAHNLAFFQIIALGLILSIKEVEKFINKRFLYFVFLFNIYALYTTLTRGAMLAFLAAVPFYFFRNNKKYFLMAMTLIALGGFTAYKMAGKNLQRSGSDSERVSQWKAAWAGFKERPLLGYGYLNFEHHSKEIKIRNNIERQDFNGHAHNSELEILACTGIVGFLFYAAWISIWFMEMYKRNDLIAKIGLPFIIAFLVGGFTQSTIGL